MESCSDWNCTGIADSVLLTLCSPAESFIIVGSTVLPACIGMSDCQFVSQCKSPDVQPNAQCGTELQSASLCKNPAACAEDCWSLR